MKFELFQTESMYNALTESLNVNYGKFFFKLSKEEKNVYLERIPFVLSNALYLAFVDIFPASRVHFTSEFALDIFSMVFSQLQGLLVSSSYIKSRINKFFTSAYESNFSNFI
jgi:hypothetical protein